MSRQTSDGQGWGTISRTFDLAGNLTRTTWQDGFNVDYDRLVTGELSKVRENGATSGVGVLATYAYDDLGRRTSLTFGNGASQAYSYDAVGRLASLTNDLSGTANDLSVTFGYNPASQIASTVRTGDAYAFAGYANSNTGYAQNGLNQQVTIGGSSASWDARGNLTADPTSGKTYTYSSENLLASASGGVSLYYDPVGRLSEYDTNVSSRFMSDGAEIAVEIDNPAGNVVRRFVRGDGPDELIAWYEGSGTSNRRFASRDERGSVISVTDSSGNLVAINSYDEYGIPGASNIGRFQYTGQMWLPEIGMQYSKARIYSPTLGRFLQTDPIGYGDGPNWYAYTHGDPVNGSDPNGLSCDGGTVGTQGEDCSDVEVAGKRLHVAAPEPSNGAALHSSAATSTIGSSGDGGGLIDLLIPIQVCPAVDAKITGVGPNQANSSNPTSISQTPGNAIPPGGVAIDPLDFGVPNARGAARDALADVLIIPLWSSAKKPSNGAPPVPQGLPSSGPYRVVDVIGPASARNQPGLQLDLYRYKKQSDALASTRTVRVIPIIPKNNAGVTCPTGK